MSLSVACPGCAATYSVGDHLAGKRVKCKKCGSVIDVSPPTRFLPPSSRRAGRLSHRRRKSFPIGPILATGCAIAVLLIGIVIAVNFDWDRALSFVGVSEEERYARRISSMFEELVSALEGVTDEASAKEAAVTIGKCRDEFAAIIRERNEWKKELVNARNTMSKAEVDAKLKELNRLAAKYEPEARRMTDRFKAEVARISRIETASPVIMPALASFSHAAAIAEMGSPLSPSSALSPQFAQTIPPPVTGPNNRPSSSGWEAFVNESRLKGRFRSTIDESRVTTQELRDRQAALSPDRKVTFILEGAKASGEDVIELSNRLRQITGAQDFSGMTEGTAYVVVLSPVTTDVEVFKTQIGFGEVIAIDLETRTITIQLAEKHDGINRKRKS